VNRDAWIKDFLRPFNIATIVLAAGGIALGWYFGAKSTEKISVVYSQKIQQLYDYNVNGSAINITDKNGKKINADLYSDELRVTNTGNVRLDMVDKNTRIRNPLTIEVYEKAGNDKNFTPKIISAASLDFNKTNSNISFKDSNVVMTWQHFDPGTTISILILYTGDYDTYTDVSLDVDSRQDIFINKDKEVGSIFSRFSGLEQALFLLVFYVGGSSISFFTRVRLERKFRRRSIIIAVSIINGASIAFFVTLAATYFFAS
jgi:hypothetical protein